MIQDSQLMCIVLWTTLLFRSCPSRTVPHLIIGDRRLLDIRPGHIRLIDNILGELQSLLSSGMPEWHKFNPRQVQNVSSLGYGNHVIAWDGFLCRESARTTSKTRTMIQPHLWDTNKVLPHRRRLLRNNKPVVVWIFRHLDTVDGRVTLGKYLFHNSDALGGKERI
jgi:hypothetical protein